MLLCSSIARAGGARMKNLGYGILIIMYGVGFLGMLIWLLRGTVE